MFTNEAIDSIPFLGPFGAGLFRKIIDRGEAFAAAPPFTTTHHQLLREETLSELVKHFLLPGLLIDNRFIDSQITWNGVIERQRARKKTNNRRATVCEVASNSSLCFID